MKKNSRELTWIGAIALALALAGCRAAAPVPTIAATDTLAPTPSYSPTATDTPTGTYSPTETQTETPTFTPTLPYNAPGVYNIYLCSFIAPSGSMEAASMIKFCITTVNVLEDRTMRFNVTWTFTISPRSEYDYHPRWLSKFSDRNNPNISLADDVNNHYSPMDVTGCIAEGFTLRNWTGDCSGSFFFYPAQPGATSFTYFDTGYSIAIGPIVLLHLPPTPTATRTGTQKTPTPTKTMTFTKTPTSTSTIDPNIVYNLPGTYWIYRCVPCPVTGNITGADSLTLCLNTVVINPDGTMKFALAWKMSTERTTPISKQSDANNRNIYLLDDLNNRYDHFETGGCAAENSRLFGKVTSCSGWFLFPAADPGATSFQFVNLDLLVYIDDIVFVKK